MQRWGPLASCAPSRKLCLRRCHLSATPRTSSLSLPFNFLLERCSFTFNFTFKCVGETGAACACSCRSNWSSNATSFWRPNFASSGVISFSSARGKSCGFLWMLRGRADVFVQKRN